MIQILEKTTTLFFLINQSSPTQTEKLTGTAYVTLSGTPVLVLVARQVPNNIQDYLRPLASAAPQSDSFFSFGRSILNSLPLPFFGSEDLCMSHTPRFISSMVSFYKALSPPTTSSTRSLLPLLGLEPMLCHELRLFPLINGSRLADVHE